MPHLSVSQGEPDLRSVSIRSCRRYFPIEPGRRYGPIEPGPRYLFIERVLDTSCDFPTHFLARKALSLNMGMYVFLLYVLWLASEIALSRVKLAGPADRKLDRSSLRILWITIAVSVTAGVFLGLRSAGHFGKGSPVFEVAGTALILLGLVIRWVAILSLKRQFTVDVAITAGHRLIKNGIYGIVRHPSYAGGLLSFLGLGLSFSNYLSLVAVFAPICAAFLYRIDVEERALTGAFGDEYTAYCASTKRLIPGIY